MNIESEEEKARIAKEKRDKRLAYGANYRAKNKDALLIYNRAYFEKKKDDEEFVRKQRESISISKKKRRIEDKKGNLGVPKRAYIRKIPDPEVL
jgi:hypothetical protein